MSNEKIQSILETEAAVLERIWRNENSPQKLKAKRDKMIEASPSIVTKTKTTSESCAEKS
jgi:hypothetical protein